MFVVVFDNVQLQGSSGIFSKITFGEDVEFLTQRQRALEVSLVVQLGYNMYQLITAYLM